MSRKMNTIPTGNKGPHPFRWDGTQQMVYLINEVGKSRLRQAAYHASDFDADWKIIRDYIRFGREYACRMSGRSDNYCRVLLRKYANLAKEILENERQVPD